MTTEWFEPKEHDLVFDTEKQVVAEVMEVGPSRVNLRPPTGGTEWERSKACLRRPTTSELVGAKTRLANHQTANRPKQELG